MLTEFTIQAVIIHTLSIGIHTLANGHPISFNRKRFIYLQINGFLGKWPDKSTTSYDMLDFESDIENL